ncbi:GNAT family N-acetyltransferase [Virgibacillus pantothenticus]|uniref:GNAT family N-acetyltransferase n=1 Tax=Virgibacillus pantothenticus TaxID=1473 RepID=UPI0028166827|nr:GNAT family N-acetyltransferase [Virgibacillus pantothenticus]MEB5451084.1 GNAT family N-acetyltransferase [Virgibacillus pantothenticus]MEB5455020.1 GNAT family N-acetyltransferase [Virgibacillus pantothenticus]MEB5459910.1 GNAT family N-acetyltransferase [Virgibacillus pantothenticus]MEB5463214.1 GNAT family N-acetyltransferase [Virgibacillus pantothenticus]MEB5467313.1 GNAT family N-acetyltransferase [Virgibacillus pantothenticus]
MKTITKQAAKKIVKWKYEPPYSMYNMTNDLENIQELTDGSYFAVYHNYELVGYFCYGANAQVPSGMHKGLYLNQNLLDIGLGLRPDLTGKRKGYHFLNTGLTFGELNYGLSSFRLSVATFNQRAINLYKKAGFSDVATFMNKNGDKKVEFIVMVK